MVTSKSIQDMKVSSMSVLKQYDSLMESIPETSALHIWDRTGHS